MAMFKLTPAADSDLQEIWEYTENRWGAEQADNYLRKLDRRMTYLARNPKRGKRRTELPVTSISYHEQKHAIFYRCKETGIEIIRILHGSMEFPRHLERR
jgi:toxin ParE1/3/4